MSPLMRVPFAEYPLLGMIDMVSGVLGSPIISHTHAERNCRSVLQTLRATSPYATNVPY
jgi:hypothetical protein